jgi:hypothetical protein
MFAGNNCFLHNYLTDKTILCKPNQLIFRLIQGVFFSPLNVYVNLS